MEKTQVCRQISLRIPKRDDSGHQQPGFIQAVQPKRQKMRTADFLASILPGHRIEHVGRETLGFLSDGYISGYIPPSSLFFQTVHSCFTNHHPLTLRPEVLMFLIAHEIAVTVNLNPSMYSNLFTRSRKKVKIDVRHDGLTYGDPESPWGEAIALFRPRLEEVVPPGIMQHMLPGFTTATPETDAASLVVFMNAAQKFYDYHTYSACGIPDIRLAGTPEDYRKILNAATQLSEVFAGTLGRYFKHLLPILQKIAGQAAGESLNEAFWSSIYKFNSGSGSDTFNGWISAFVNYVQPAEGDLVIKRSKFPKGVLTEKSANAFDWTRAEEKPWDFHGLPLGSVPSHVSTAPFTFHYLDTEYPMLFAGGVLAIDIDNGSLMPGLSYAVLQKQD
ncbi:DUF4419 domain-containing protein [Candidatus Falkowbacteria bacterium]|nr:DUF4419 domain-containing protein [Candidatus Falkowbacteria bacterium]